MLIQCKNFDFINDTECFMKCVSSLLYSIYSVKSYSSITFCLYIYPKKTNVSLNLTCFDLNLSVFARYRMTLKP